MHSSSQSIQRMHHLQGHWIWNERIEPLGNTSIHIIFRTRLSLKWRILVMGELKCSRWTLSQSQGLKYNFSRKLANAQILLGWWYKTRTIHRRTQWWSGHKPLIFLAWEAFNSLLFIKRSILSYLLTVDDNINNNGIGVTSKCISVVNYFQCA